MTGALCLTPTEGSMEVKIHHEKMTEDEFNSAAETLAAMIVNHILAKEMISSDENNVKNTNCDQKGSEYGIMRPV